MDDVSRNILNEQHADAMPQSPEAAMKSVYVECEGCGRETTWYKAANEPWNVPKNDFMPNTVLCPNCLKRVPHGEKTPVEHIRETNETLERYLDESKR